MRSFVKLLVVLLICLVAIGLYRGWFSFSGAARHDNGDKFNVDLSVDKGKMKADVRKAEENVKEEVKELEAKAKAK